jgi:MazG family protein
VKEFDEFVEVLDTLFGPQGCPWDREQTFQSMRAGAVEEIYELLEAINLNDNEKIRDELGDVMLSVLFFCKMAEKEKRFTTQDMMRSVTQKLIRRHPHVFGDVKLDQTEHVVKQWDEIKKTERGHEARKSALDGIPKELTMLPRARKIAAKVIKAGYSLPQSPANNPEIDPEIILGEKMWELVLKAQQSGLSPEDALLRVLCQKESAFREFERNSEQKSCP